ncbi:AlpA family phage regulatory protein [Curvibacter sp. HBC61]|uniref:AlpA family phage regulatory protein n=1 Tax=Curvibacter cyanobacteriorum TaxID=3026422 RepID=A0ABT5MUY0_9BURK|nr:AlpA family phage regulatory protein [Curvibacter sp. HBC61]MDD0837855.1 AlpA family phage regulatory protein [Curvibacter sp. HBC61]
MIVAVEPAYLDREKAAAFVSMSEQQIARLAAQGEFPKPRMLSNQRVGWLVRELREWSENRPVSSILPPPNPTHKAQKKAA